MFAIYTATLNPKNKMPIIVPCRFFPFTRKSNTQRLMPSTNHISFVRTVDTAYISVPPTKMRSFAANATIKPTAAIFTLANVGVTRKIKNSAYKYQYGAVG